MSRILFKNSACYNKSTFEKIHNSGRNRFILKIHKCMLQYIDMSQNNSCMLYFKLHPNHILESYSLLFKILLCQNTKKLDPQNIIFV